MSLDRGWYLYMPGKCANMEEGLTSLSGVTHVPCNSRTWAHSPKVCVKCGKSKETEMVERFRRRLYNTPNQYELSKLQACGIEQKESE